MRLLIFHAALILAVLLCGVDSTYAQSINLERPGEREFVVDNANLISDKDKESLQSLCDKLLTETAAPIIIVTIESMSKYSKYSDMRIETFAHLLFDQWEIGHIEVDGKPRNDGILLLVSRDDRKARIQFGEGWGRAYDDVAQRIMNGRIIPKFKGGDFSGGIKAGVRSLEDLARAGPQSAEELKSKHNSTVKDNGPLSFLGIPSDTCFSWTPCSVFLFIILSKIIGAVFYKGTEYEDRWEYFFNSFSSNGGGGGGFSGGSFGGGSSGGGGASGSW